jgi:predicted small integral membrane protein
MTLEFLVGILASIGLIKMLKNLFKSDQLFEDASSLVEYACLLGFFIWGFIFFCIGGDYFLSWKNTKLESLQSGSLMYATLLAIVYFIFVLGRTKDNAHT